MHSERHGSEAGIALVAVLLIMSLLLTFVAGLTTAIIMEFGLRGAYSRTTTGFYAAESGLNRGMGDYRDIFMSYGVPKTSDLYPNPMQVGNRTVTYQLTPVSHQNVVIPVGQLFGGLNSDEYMYVVNSQASSNYYHDVEANVSAEFDVENIPLFQFVAFYTNDLEILPGPNMNLNGWVHTNANLYLNSGATLNIVHNAAVGINTIQVTAAGDIYRGRKDGQISPTCGGTVNVDKLNNTPLSLDCTSSSNRLVQPSELAQWQGSMVSRIRALGVPLPDIIKKGTGVFWTKAELRIVLKLNQRGAANGPPAIFPHDVQVQNVDGSLDVLRTQSLINFMTDKAWNAANSTYVTTKPIFYTEVPINGGGCTCTDANPINCTNAIATCYLPAFINANASAGYTNDNRVYGGDMTTGGAAFDIDPRRGGFYNWRERKWMLLLNINIGDLLLWNKQKGGPLFDPQDTTDGGPVIFATIDGAASNTMPNNYGVRVFGGRNLPITSPNAGDPTGLTLVSDQALYVLGDYNRANTGAGDLSWQPAALIGDSMNVLSSNYWQVGCANNNCARNDRQSILTLGDANRDGTTTTINSAFLAGVDSTVPGGAYNGGLENYPRFHEDWNVTVGATTTQQQFTYSGSFVSLGSPQHVNGQWCGTGGSITGGALNGCNIYNPPIRAWNYDPRFNTFSNLPPLTPEFTYVQQVLFTENFQ